MLHVNNLPYLMLSLNLIILILNISIYTKTQVTHIGVDKLNSSLQSVKASLHQVQELVKKSKHTSSNAASSSHPPAPAHDTTDNFEPQASNKLYIGNVDYSVSEEELESIFAPYGALEFVNIPINRYTGKARGFGFVTFSDLHAAQQAVALNGSDLKGRPLQVSFAKERA